MNAKGLKSKHPIAYQAMKAVYGLFSFRFRGKWVQGLRNRARFRRDYQRFSAKAADTKDMRFEMSWHGRMPMLDEGTSTTAFDPHYLYHTSWAARLVAKNHPKEHQDFASDVRFATLVSAFIPLVFHDYRPLNVELSGLRTTKADLAKIDLEDESVLSLSCMHVVEHIGLGRYGDPIDPQGDMKAMGELMRILSRGGDLYFVVPVGHPRIRFNAHRIYSFEMVRSSFRELELKEFSLIDDSGKFIPRAAPEMADKQNYGCGCFWFKKGSK